MKLTHWSVDMTFRECLADEGSSDTVDVDGIVATYRFDNNRVRAHADDIVELLLQLPLEFRMSGGGGWSFLQACVDRSGRQWGEHQDMARLFALGEAAGFVQCQMPRHLWGKLPGGMPYYVILDKEDRVEVSK